MSKKQTVYRIIFFNQETVCELYAKNLDQESLYGFIEVSNIIFGQNSELLVDPAQERLKTEFQNVETTYVPLHSIIRIDQVEKEGLGGIRDVSNKGNVRSLSRTFPDLNKAPLPTLDT
jgi:hypothetical protein